MAWIESHDELPTHPKTRKAARKLKVCVPQVIGHLHVLWYWCLTHRPDGRLDGMDVDDIADAAGWDDDGDVFTDALLAAGWLDDDAGTLVVHDWWEGAGKTIKRRKYATARQRKARDTDEVTPDPDPGHNEHGNESHDSHADVTRDTTVSHVADSDRDSDREHKPTPVGNGEPFEKRLAKELREDHGWDYEPTGVRYDAFHALLDGALERLPEDRHHGIAMGVISRFVETVQDLALTTEARSHTGRLVKNYSPAAVLHGYGEALDWGAGTTEDYADDPLALSKYVARIVSKSKRGAA